MAVLLISAAILPAAEGVRVLTSDAGGHILANRNCWSPDGEWIVYDTRSDETVFDATRICRVHATTGEVQTLFESDSPVGVPTYGRDGRIVFLAAPEGADDQWAYAAWHRHGLLLGPDGTVSNLDARDVAPPFHPGALRGGTHLHTFSPGGRLVASTYEDHVLATSGDPDAAENLRTVAVTALDRPVRVPNDHARNRDGHHTVVAARVTDSPRPGTDDISRAFSDAWLTDDRIAFLGRVRAADGTDYDELFVCDLPEAFDASDVGTLTTRPQPPGNVSQRRVTVTKGERHPGVSGPRFWPVGDSDGSRAAVYRRDDAGRVRLCVVEVETGASRFVTSGEFAPHSAFTWSPAGPLVALVADGSVFVVNVETGVETRLTPTRTPGPRHHACVFSPDGRRVAFMLPVASAAGTFDQIAVVDVPADVD